MTRVFLLDDHEVVRRGVRELLEAEDDIEVVGEAETAEQAINRIPPTRPDVALLDVRLPDGDGVEVCREVRSRDPGGALLDPDLVRRRRGAASRRSWRARPAMSSNRSRASTSSMRSGGSAQDRRCWIRASRRESSTGCGKALSATSDWNVSRTRNAAS